MQNIREHHGGIEQLRSAFSAAALGTFTNGWVWFISDQAGRTSTTTTYGPSTLLIRSRTVMQRSPATIDDPRVPAPPFPHVPSNPLPGASPTPSGLPDGDMPLAPSSSENLNSDTSFMNTKPTKFYASGGTTRSPKPNFLNTGELLYPLFCLPVYEHAWMSAGYGVWGKEQWLKEFWSVLDWRKVNTVYDDITSSYQSSSYS
jgi:Fe-Mn family superoxide dismutase